MTATTPTRAADHVAFSRLLWVAPLTIVVAIVANVVVQQIAVALLPLDPAFMPLTIAPPIVFTLIGVLGAVVVYALLGRFSRRPVALFRRIALIALVVSFIPDLLMLVSDFIPGATVAGVVVLLIMHVVAWAITVGMLTRLASVER